MPGWRAVDSSHAGTSRPGRKRSALHDDDAAGRERPAVRGGVDEAASDRSRRTDPRRRRQRVRRRRRGPGRARARRPGDERVRQRRGDSRSTTRRRSRSCRSTPRARPRVSRRSIGTKRTTAARCPSTTRCCRRSCLASSTRGARCSTRWGTMSLAQVLQPAIETAEQGFPLTRGLAESMNTAGKLKKYPTSVKLYQPGGRHVARRRRVQEPRCGTPVAQARRGGERLGRTRAASRVACRARSLLQGRHRAHDGRLLGRARRAVPLRRLCQLRRRSRSARVDELSRLRHLQERVGQPGRGRAHRAQPARGLRSEEARSQQRRRTSTPASRR